MQKEGKRRLVILGTGILLFTLMGILTGGPASSAAKQVSWNLQSAYVPGDLAYQLVADFAKKVEEATNGQVKITVHTEGAVVPTSGIFDSVSKGVIEGGHAAGVYYSGKIPVGLMEIGAPYQFESGEDFYNIVYKRGGMEIFRAAYAEHNNFLIGFTPNGHYDLYTNSPIRKVEDFKGMKLRAWGPYGHLFKELGAAIVSTPGPEIYMSMERGIIDGTMYTAAEIKGLKLYEVIKYVMRPPLAKGVSNCIFVNKGSWDALPDKTKETILRVSEESFLQNYQRYLQADEEAYTEARKVGVKFVALPEDEIKKIKSIARERVWPAVAKASPRCAELMEIVRKYYETK
jgi:TRAP-type mannitol/chloroaromatic compound transport system substrate-binding protein